MSTTPSEGSGGGFPLRALAMVLIALAVIFGAIGAFSLSGGDEPQAGESSATTTTTVPAAAAAAPASTTPPALPPTVAGASKTGTATKTATTTTAPGASGAVDKTIPVRVLNNGTVAGQAAKTGAQLKASGWNVTSMENYKSGQVPASAAYYTESAPTEKAAATAIAKELGIDVQPRFSGIASSAPGVIVIMTTR